MAITLAERTQIIKLTVMMFNAAPGETYLSQIVSVYESTGRSLQNLANALGGTPAYQSINTNFQTAEEFAAALLTPLGLQNDSLARDFVIAKMNAGVPKGQIAYEGYVALTSLGIGASPQYVAANAILANKTAVAEYYSVTKALAVTDLAALQGALSSVTADPASVDAAKSAIDASTNSAPNLTSAATGTVVENAAVSTAIYTAVATDPNGDVLTYSLKSGTGDVSMLNINASTGAVTLKASADFETKASYSFTVVATDVHGASVEKAVVVAVQNAVDAPIITSGATGSVNENEDAAVAVYTATSTDPDAGATVAYSLSGADAALLNISSAGVVTLKASANFEAKSSYSFNVVATDNDGLTSTKAVVVTVGDVNEAPVITSGATAASIAENGAAGAAVYTVTVTDDAGATQTYSLSGADAALFDINATTGVVTLKAAADFEAKSSYSFDVVATDNGGLTASQTVTLGVTNVNEAPVVTSSATGSFAENGTAGAVVYTAAASDVDAGTTLSYSLSGADAALFDINSSTGAVSIKAAANFEAKSTYNFDVIASDGALSATQAVTLSVTNVNEGPSGSADSASTADNTAVTINVLSNDTDIDGDTLSVASVTQGANGTVVNNGGTVTYTPNPSFLNGTDTFTYVATDAGGLTTGPITVTVTVNTVNNAPVITAAQSFSVTENVNTAGLSVGFVAATDEEGGTPQNWTIVSGNEAGNFVINKFTGEITQSSTANFDAEGTQSYTLTLTTSDGAGLTSAPQTVTINVGDQNDNTPVITSAATASVAEGSTTVATVTATDADITAAPRTFAIAGGADAALFTIDAATGALSFAAAPNFEAPADAGADNVYNVTVTASDGVNTSAAQAITVTVTDINDTAPVITSGGVAAFAENTAIGTAVYTATSTDADTTGEARTYTLGGADAALFDINSTTGAVTFKASPNFEAPADAGADNVYDITVTATDGTNTSATQAVAITVSNVNEAPTAVADTATALSGQLTNIAVLGNDSDTDGAFVGTITAVTQPALGGLVEIAGDGQSINFTSTPGFASTTPVTFTYTVRDAGGLTSTATVSVTVSTQLGGTTGADNLIGSSAAETLEGGAGNDTINGGSGADVIDAGGDDDTVTFYGAENNISGGAGTDTLKVAATMSTLFGVDLSVSQNQTYRYSDSDGDGTGFESNDLTSTSVAGFENLDASAVTVNLVVDNLVSGRTLTDANYGDNANSTSIKTGSGNDSIQVGNHTAALTVYAGAGTDTINSYGTVSTTIYGEGGVDTITAQTAGGAVTIDGGAGNDVITGNTGNDSLVGGADDDTIVTGNGNNTVQGGDGVDTITTGTGIDSVDGGVGNDTVKFADANLVSSDSVTGGDGTDILEMTDTASIADVDLTNFLTVETIKLAAGTAAQTVALGAEALQAGIVTIDGTVSAQDVTVTVAAGYTGNLTVLANSADNSVTGGSGNDVIVSNASFQLDTTATTDDSIAGGTGTDTIRLDNNTSATDNTGNAVTMTVGAGLVSGVENITINDLATDGAGDATVSFVAGFAMTSGLTVDGSALDAGEVLTVDVSANTGSETVTILGGAADDVFTLSATADSASGAAGADTFKFAEANLASSDSVTGGEGTDVLEMTDTAAITDAELTNFLTVETIKLAAGTAAQTVALGAEALQAGIVTIDGTVSANDVTVTVAAGYTGNLTVLANSADNSVTGGAGNDVIVSNASFQLDTTATTDDSIAGGTGTDTIRLDNNTSATDNTGNAVTMTVGAGLVSGVENITINDLATDGAGDATVSFVAGFAMTSGLTVDGSALDAGEVLTVDVSANTGSETVTILGGAADDVFTLSATADSASGAAGADTFKFAEANLASSDSVTGGEGTDVLEMTDTAAITDAELTNFLTVETIKLAAGTAAQTVALGAEALEAGIVTIDGTLNTQDLTVTVAAGYTGNLTVLASSADNSVTGGSGNDVIVSNATFQLDTSTTNDDSIAGGAGTDTIRLDNDSGTDGTGNAVTMTVGAGLASGVENITINDTATDNAAGDVTVNFAAGFAMTSGLTIDGTALDAGEVLTVDVSANTGSETVTILGGAADDAFALGGAADSASGGLGNDTFNVSVANLASNDGIDGGGGTADVLALSSNGTVTDVQFTQVSGVEKLNLTAGAGSYTLGAQAQEGGITTVTTGADADAVTSVTINAGAYTSAITITAAAGSGAYSMFGGAGNDTLNLGGGSAADFVQGGAGADTVTLSAGASADTLRINLSSELASGTTVASADTYNNFVVNTDQIELVGGTLASGGGGQVVLSTTLDDLQQAGDVYVASTLAELATFNAGGVATAYVVLLDDNATFGANGFTGGTSAATAQGAVNAAVTYLTGNGIAGTTSANTNVILGVEVDTDNDGASNGVALFQYQEGALDAGIQGSELTLIGIFNGIDISGITAASFK